MNILFIDDEKRRMGVITEEFSLSGHHVKLVSLVDEALQIVSDPAQHFDLVILDVSMPPGNALRSEDTYGGTRTGIQLYREIRKQRPNLKVIVYTNVADRGVAQHFGNEPKELCRFLRKPDVLPFQLVETAEQFAAGQTEELSE